MLRSTLFRLYTLLMLAVMTAGCELIEGVFKAGMWVGILMVMLVLGIVIWLASKLMRRT